MSMDGPMWRLCCEVMRLVRDEPGRVYLKVADMELQRALCDAMGAEYDAHPKYDGELDCRVIWLREVICTARRGPAKWRTPAWHAVEFLLDEELDGETRWAVKGEG